MELSRPFRILMLHGYLQNELMFRDKTGGLRKNLKKYAELIYCEAPFDVPKTNNLKETTDVEVNQESQNEKCWYWKYCDVEFDFENDFPKSLNRINQVFKENGPFDGIWGFSQGAEMVAIICNILTNPLLSSNEIANVSDIKFKFAIISATGKSKLTNLHKYYDSNRKIDLPTFHIIGKNDKIIPFQNSLELTNYFLNPKIYIHELGHFIPAKKDDINAYVEFLNEMREKFKI